MALRTTRLAEPLAAVLAKPASADFLSGSLNTEPGWSQAGQGLTML
jgi:hypothetical protein